MSRYTVSSGGIWTMRAVKLTVPWKRTNTCAGNPTLRKLSPGVRAQLYAASEGRRVKHGLPQDFDEELFKFGGWK